MIAALRCGRARSPAAATTAAACPPARLPCLQVLGTHNSYHQAPPQELLAKFGGLTSGPLQAWQYNQPGPTAQLDTGAWRRRGWRRCAGAWHCTALHSAGPDRSPSLPGLLNCCPDDPLQACAPLSWMATGTPRAAYMLKPRGCASRGSLGS